MKRQGRITLLIMLAISLLMPIGGVTAQSVREDGDSKESKLNLNQDYKVTTEAASKKAQLLVESYNTNSVQYALIDQGKIVISGAVSKDSGKGKDEVSASTLYSIGSTSKVFTAVAVMKLVEEGKVDLDTPVVNYIKDFKMKDSRYKQITPRMLLNHSSGLQGGALGNAFMFEDPDTYAHDQLLAQLAEQNLKSDPGAFSVYCNDGFTLAEILVERVSGLSFTDYIHNIITKPLDMKYTRTPQDKVEPSQAAPLYYPSYPGQLPNETVNLIGSGGIYSTAEDLAKFSQIFTGQVDTVISKKSAEAMQQEEYKRGMWPKEADTAISFGLGWDTVNMFPFSEYGIQALSKGGDTILYHASLVVLPEYNMAAAVLSSGGTSITDQVLANEILLSALQEKGIITELKPEKSHGIPVEKIMPKEVVAYAGIYGMTNGLIKADITEEGELTVSVLNIPNYPPEKFIYTAGGSFVKEDGSAKASFVREQNGRIYLWLREYTALPGLGQTALSQYTAEKLEAHSLPTEVQAAWKKREGKKYFAVNEKYSSVMYLVMMPVQTVVTLPEAPNYLLNRKMIDADKAVSELQIPVINGRDTMDYNFYNQNGLEYLDIGGKLYVREEAVKPIYKGTRSYLTIQENGHARWLSIPDALAGKTMKVQVPANGSFAVYNEHGVCVHFERVSGSNDVDLPRNGVIVFAGDQGAKFQIDLQSYTKNNQRR
ncbi:serine hydrolase domain-containing protein [Paenibacillus lentus]|uniref:Class A beta-lactamase-related serine hydrolase n=1 Tax=Paenibacillus lentus TaxID=1338368 RepID=A0A3S8RXP1_9BACL|nr:serine hydrolase domain-containing protein [Paenibacillus lentus]AZK47593.1 class A beta-lactamase-related serine hydrolase [Paenibacillus lentus]